MKSCPKWKSKTTFISWSQKVGNGKVVLFFWFEPIFINKTGSDPEKKHGKWIFFEAKKHTAPNFSYGLTYDERLPKTFCADIFGWGQRHFCPFVAPARARALYHEKFRNFFFDAATFKVMQNAVHSHILQVSRSFCCREIALFLISEESLLSGQKTSIGRHEHMGGTRPKRLGDLGPIWKVLWNYGIKKNFVPTVLNVYSRN